ncbi:unnamed protein product [Prorocentrum cordatum]|uniref:Uncharacterized protein n=1 Tax=Prorocentrum cordatum TaxID=2364126 RepID=A0ABN9Q7F3_9DINO|nr:unnamed protein product [Polarella glacialis]
MSRVARSSSGAARAFGATHSVAAISGAWCTGGPQRRVSLSKISYGAQEIAVKGGAHPSKETKEVIISVRKLMEAIAVVWELHPRGLDLAKLETMVHRRYLEMGQVCVLESQGSSTLVLGSARRAGVASVLPPERIPPSASKSLSRQTSKAGLLSGLAELGPPRPALKLPEPRVLMCGRGSDWYGRTAVRVSPQARSWSLHSVTNGFVRLPFLQGQRSRRFTAITSVPYAAVVGVTLRCRFPLTRSVETTSAYPHHPQMNIPGSQKRFFRLTLLSIVGARAAHPTEGL